LFNSIGKGASSNILLEVYFMPVNGMEMKVAKNDDAEPGRVPAITAMITARILFQLNFA